MASADLLDRKLPSRQLVGYISPCGHSNIMRTTLWDAGAPGSTENLSEWELENRTGNYRSDAPALRPPILSQGW